MTPPEGGANKRTPTAAENGHRTAPQLAAVAAAPKADASCGPIFEKFADLSPTARYLCITHSGRPTQLAQCDLNFLEMRYSTPHRLPPSQPFETLSPAAAHSVYQGAISIYDIGPDGRGEPRCVAKTTSTVDKPQHSVWLEGRLWIVTSTAVAAYDREFRRLGGLTDNWLAGGHTIAATAKRRLLVSCSASDSVLLIDPSRFEVLQAWRMPESLYGVNYRLSREDSVVDHFVPNDLQLTHVNCAWPWRGGVLTSALIPGAVGWFDPHGRFEELLRGFVGCHGARSTADGQIYFCDSCTGTVVFLDGERRPQQRVGTGSRWLHDAVQVAGDIFALALYDREEVWIMDIASRRVLQVIDCAGSGGPQFLAF